MCPLPAHLTVYISWFEESAAKRHGGTADNYGGGQRQNHRRSLREVLIPAGGADRVRGSKPCSDIRLQRDSGEEKEPDSQVPEVLLGPYPVDDRSRTDHLSRYSALGRLRDHLIAAPHQRDCRFLAGETGRKRHRDAQGAACDRGEGAARRQVAETARTRARARRHRPYTARGCRPRGHQAHRGGLPLGRRVRTDRGVDAGRQTGL